MRCSYIDFSSLNICNKFFGNKWFTVDFSVFWKSEFSFFSKANCHPKLENALRVFNGREKTEPYLSLREFERKWMQQTDLEFELGLPISLFVSIFCDVTGTSQPVKIQWVILSSLSEGRKVLVEFSRNSYPRYKRII